MVDFVPAIKQALRNIGLDSQRVTTAVNGGELYGEAGVLDSLDFVRFISELTQQLDGIEVDVFELVENLDENLPGAFRSIEALSLHLQKTACEVTA